jgi:hypothetical protein
MKNEINKKSVMVNADLYDEIFSFIDSARATTTNKQVFDEALIILKKLEDEKQR